MQSVQVLQCSNVDAFDCVNLHYVECEVNKQTKACNLVNKDHIRHQSERIHHIEVSFVLNTVLLTKLYSVTAELYTNQKSSRAKNLLNKLSAIRQPHKASTMQEHPCDVPKLSETRNVNCQTAAEQKQDAASVMSVSSEAEISTMQTCCHCTLNVLPVLGHVRKSVSGQSLVIHHRQYFYQPK